METTYVTMKPGNSENGWYVVSIGLHNGKLAIHYETSLEKRSDQFDLAEFKAPEDLCAKFRRPSTQVEDRVRESDATGLYFIVTNQYFLDQAVALHSVRTAGSASVFIVTNQYFLDQLCFSFSF